MAATSVSGGGAMLAARDDAHPLATQDETHTDLTVEH